MGVWVIRSELDGFGEKVLHGRAFLCLDLRLPLSSKYIPPQNETN
jgi:hypothetical protein